MKKAKMVAIVAAMTTALVMALSASSAMAATDTTLCKSATAPCPTASQYPADSMFSATLAPKTTSVLTTNIDTVTCTSSSTTLQNNEQSGTPLTGQINSLSFSGCTDSNGATCTVTITGTPYPGTVSYTSPGDGTLTVDSVNAKVVCSDFIDCTFTAPSSGISGTLTGGNPATVKFASATLNHSSGTFCPSTATYSATYQTTGTNAAVWVEQPS